MITNTDTSRFKGKAITTYFEGDIKLSPIETYKWPESVLKTYAVEDGTIELHYNARIEWTNHTVHITIGDYIMMSWVMGDMSPVTFRNEKGYGDKHFHSYIEYLPIAILSDVTHLLMPEM